MKREFRFEFDDQSAEQTLAYEADGADVLTTGVENGVPVISGNPGGFLVLARILVQLALGDYRNGFHVHLQQDFDPGKPDCLTLTVDRSHSIAEAPHPPHS